MKKITPVIVPFECGDGASTFGAQFGPSAFFSKHHGSYEWDQKPQLMIGDNVSAYKYLSTPEERARRAQSVFDSCLSVHDRVLKILRDGYYPVTFGGDHSLPIGSIAALADFYQAYENIGVIWIDAHGDLNIPRTSPSGALHGMSLAALLGYGDEKFTDMAQNRPVLDPKHICIFGARDLDPAEIFFAEKHDIRIFWIQEILEKGIVPCFEEALSVINQADYKVISLDIDSMSPDFLLATGTPVSGGLYPDDLIKLLGDFNMLSKTHLFELVEFNPLLGDASNTADLMHKILSAALRA